MNLIKLFEYIVRYVAIVALCALGEVLTAAEANKPDDARPPGVVIDHRAASMRQYIGSPSIAILPSGDYAASHDWFGPGSTQNRTAVFASGDKGKNWKQLTEIEGQWWSTLFFHDGALYIIGTSRDNGFTVIRRSTD